MAIYKIVDKYYKDHPRIRGTNLQTPKNQYPYLGSSPHTRDKYKFSASAVYLLGIIPAYAGQMPF